MTTELNKEGKNIFDPINLHNWFIGRGIKTPHVCEVLKAFLFTLNYCELINDLNPQQIKLFDIARIYLDMALVRNQHTINQISKPLNIDIVTFMADYDINKIDAYLPIINANIRKASLIKYDIKKIPTYNEIDYPKDIWKLFDIKEVYYNLISILYTIELKDAIFEELIEKAKNGYYIGFLMEKYLREKSNNYYISDEEKKIVKRTREVYRLNVEKAIVERSIEDFGYTKKNKLKRMIKNLEILK